MAYSNVLDPTQMTPTQRHCEVAAILSQGLIRTCGCHHPAPPKKGSKQPLTCPRSEAFIQTPHPESARPSAMSCWLNTKEFE